MISFTVGIASFLVVQTKAGFYQKRPEKAKVAQNRVVSQLQFFLCENLGNLGDLCVSAVVNIRTRGLTAETLSPPRTRRE
jgi:hypothetical protein